VKRILALLVAVAGLASMSHALSYYCVFKNWQSSPSSCSSVGSTCHIDYAQVFDHCHLTVCADCYNATGPVLATRKWYYCQASFGGLYCDDSVPPFSTTTVMLNLPSCTTQYTC
jgi:hypothetical protein